MSEIRQPACAGRFYSSSEDQLSADVETFLRDVQPDKPPRAVIAPHAGYAFSGPVAGHAFGALATRGDSVERVVVVGPSHHVGFEGLSVSPHDAFETPLGQVPVDTEEARALVDQGLARFSSAPHKREHSLETHLPFLQSVFDDFTIVPIVTGHAEGQEVARVLERYWDDDSTVISVSSDLSHFLDYEQAREIDEATAGRIENLQPDRIGPDQACGFVAVRGLLEFAKAHGLDVERLHLRNSGDTAGDKSRVVGYGAWSIG
ncbi:MAG: AmmeMemoRadiSam system protein B [Myxococcota bacterium]